MARKHTHLLGIAITERSVQIAECRGSGPAMKAGKRSSFRCVGAELFDAPQQFGKRLAEHLAQEGYGAKQAAVGLCARWVLAKPVAVPPAEGDALAGMARLKAERVFAGGPGELCFDYQNAPAPVDTEDGQRGLLLAGLPTRRLEKIEDAFEAAGLQLVRVGATPLDLAADTIPKGLGLLLDPAGITLIQTHAGKCAGFATASFDTATLATDLQAPQQLAATAARLAMTGFANTGDATDRLDLADAADLDEPTRTALAAVVAERFGGCEPHAADPARAAAAAVSHTDAINLLDSKLAVKQSKTMPGYAKWLIRAAILFLLVGGVVGYLWIDATQELSSLQDEYEAIRENADRLQSVRNDTRAASGWFDDRPPVLDCLLELTHTFPKRGRIWVTSLAIQPDATGLVSCRADDEDTMWQYVIAMNESPHLTNVVLRRQNDGGNQGAETVFDVSFRYDTSGVDEEEAN